MPLATRGALAGAVRRDAGDGALVLEFGDAIDPALLERVSALDRHVRALADKGLLEGLIETVPTFRSLALLFDPLATHPSVLLDAIAAAPDVDHPGTEVRGRAVSTDDGAPREWSLPVRYGDEHGPDLEELAEHAGLSVDDAVTRHERVPLVAYMLGFLPGFAFLGDIDPALRRARRATPRTRVPAGSVAVANSLSAVYPWASPGGWHLIGHCPVPLFDASRDVPALLAPADRVRFHRVDADAHAELLEAATAGTLAPERFRRR